MATTTVDHRFDAFRPYLVPVLAFNLMVLVQLLAALVYGLATRAPLPGIVHFLVPFVWIAVAAVAVWRADPPSRPAAHTAVGLVASGAYLLVVLYLSGTLGPPTTIDPSPGAGSLFVEWQRSLGWGPTLLYSGDYLAARVIPYQLIGYLALAYLIYGAVLDISSSAAVGVIGLVPCPACAAPVVAPLLAGVAGTSSALAIILPYTYEIATALFVGAVGLLYWRPTVAELRASVTVSGDHVAAGLAGAVAWIHLSHPRLGLPRLLEHIHYWTLLDPRPLLFTLSGLAILAGVLLGIVGAPKRRLYLAGVVLFAGYLLGYVAWHTLLDHGAFWPHIEVRGHTDLGLLETVALHLHQDPRAFTSKLLELLTVWVLGVLYWRS